MRTSAAILFTTAVLAAAGNPQAAPSARPSAEAPTALLAEFEALNGACRGGRGDDPRTVEACAERDAAYRRLEALGWCFGRPGEFEYEKRWQPCRDD
jgi:hypothetical protein